MAISDTTIESLRDSLSNKDALHEPWTSGIVTLPEPAKTLFYEREDGTPRSVKLGSIIQDQAEDLSSACQPATFGLNNQDVLDETYRKAGKLDAGKFAWLFNPSDHGDFASKLASGLFPWNSLDKGIRFELYKLNVYGQGSFFKAHQDTPRDPTMFGSLVILMPFDHTGGELILRHRGREFTFDGCALLQNAPTTSAAYVAFFSDVEHEVTEVTSGHRVTITYNLYFDATKGAPLTQYNSELEHPFLTQLKNLKEDADLQRNDIALGFGLEHAYPFQSAILDPGSVHLKGNDAILVKILADLNITHRFFLLYREDEKNTLCTFRLLSNHIVHEDQEYAGDESSFNLITSKGYAWLIPDEQTKSGPAKKIGLSRWYSDWIYGSKDIPSLQVEWITEPSEEYLDKSVSLAYGNEPSLGFHYHQLCVIAVFDNDFEGKGNVQMKRKGEKENM